jgi:PhnB protein
VSQLNPYIRFNENCREAMTFYQSVLGGELQLQTVGETPMREQMPAKTHERILHAELRRDGLVLMGSDMMGSDGVSMGTAYSMVLVCSTKDEIESLYAEFAEGGTIGHPLEEAFFGTIGDCTDRFGVHWMLQRPLGV